MKKIKINFIPLLLIIGVIILTQCKTKELMPIKIQPIDPSYVAAYMPTISGVANNGGILAFSNMASFDAAYDLLTDSSNTHKIDPNDSSCATDPILDAFETNLGFTSIRKIFEDNECTFLESGGDPENFTDCHIDDDVFSAFMNEQYMVIIGEDLYYWPGENLIYSIPLSQSSKMYNFKNNNTSALEAGVQFLTAIMVENDCSSAFKWKMASSGSNVVDFTWCGTGGLRTSTSKISWTINGVDMSIYYNQNTFSHTFPAQGIYTVCCHLYDDKGTLNKDDDCETIPYCVEIDVSNCSPSFSQTSTGKTYYFTDLSTTAIISPTYDWDFGDGSPHSTAQNPSHTYACNGDRVVKLTITTPDCTTGKTFIGQKFNVNEANCCNKKTKDHGVVRWDHGHQLIKWKFKLNVVMGLNQHVTAKIVYYKKKNKFRHRKANTLDIDFSIPNLLINYPGEMGTTNVGSACECSDVYPVMENPQPYKSDVKKLHVKNKLVPMGVQKKDLVRLNKNLIFRVEYSVDLKKRSDSRWPGSTWDSIEDGYIDGAFNPTDDVNGDFDCTE